MKEVRLVQLLLLLFCFISANLSAQPILDKTITTSFDNQPLPVIFDQISKDGQLIIYYQEATLPSINRSGNFTNARLEDVLLNIIQGTELGFFTYRDYGIIIGPRQATDGQFSADYYNALEENLRGETLSEEVTVIGNEDFLDPSGQAVISGTVKDEQTDEPIIGATLLSSTLNTGTTTDTDGNFSLSLPLGRHELKLQYVGYNNHLELITLYGDGNLDLKLSKAAINLQEVTVTSKAPDFNVESAQIGLTLLDIPAVKKLPTFLGETDILKGLLLQPGVSTIGEGAIGFNVRGGAVDQNLVLQDEGVIFNTAHALGFFSTFNADLLSDVALYKGSIPAQFGGRLASVLDVKMRDGDFNRFRLKGGIGPVSSRLVVEVPLVKEKASIIGGIRSTYSNWVLDLIRVPEVQRSSVFFYDANLRYTHRLDDKKTLIFSGYSAQDDFSFNEDFGFAYQTQMGQLTYKQIFSDQLFSNLSVTVSDYVSTQSEMRGTNASDLRLRLGYLKLKERLSYIPNDKIKMEAGFSSTFYRIRPADIKPLGPSSLIPPKSLEREQALESAVFLNMDWSFSPALLFSAGLRMNGFQFFGPKTVFEYATDEIPNTTPSGATSYESGKVIADYYLLDPRFSFRYRLSPNTSLKAGYSRTSQFLNQIFNTNTATPSSQWQLSNSYISPQRSHNLSTGFFQNFKNNLWETSMEVYYRNIDQLFDYVDFARLAVNEHIETELLPGIGRAYGLEVSVKKNRGRSYGWLSYTLSRTERKVAGVNQGAWFLDNLDQPHNLTLVLNWQPNQRHSFVLNFNYASGRPTTAPIASYQEANGVFIPIYSERNQLRIPDFHRMDLAYTLGRGYKKKQKFRTSWTFSVYNIYGRRNAFSVFFTQEAFSNPKAFQLSILGQAFPAITFNLELI